MMLERRRRARERRLQKLVMSAMASKYSETAVDRLDDGYTRSEALVLLKSWVSEGLLTPACLTRIASEEEDRKKPPQDPPE